MDSWPNQEALNKALNYYRSSMRTFIISQLKKIRGKKVEEVIIDSFYSKNGILTERGNEIKNLLETSGRDIKSVIDINDFPHLINRNWEQSFEIPLSDDKTFRNQLWLIKDGRNQSWAHPPEGDVDFESTRAFLFLIADVLGKINIPEAKSNIENIRDELLSNETTRQISEIEDRIEDIETKKNEYKNHLTESNKRIEELEKEQSEDKERIEKLEKVEKEKIKLDQQNLKLSDDLKETEKAWNSSEEHLKTKKKQLIDEINAHNNLKEHVQSQNEKIEVVENKKSEYKNQIISLEKQLNDEKNSSKEKLTSIRELHEVVEKDFKERLTEMEKQLLVTSLPVFPPLDVDSTVRIIDRRNIDKKSYLINLLELKQPSIIYVISDEKIKQFYDFVGSENVPVIGKHNEQTSEAEEMELLEKLDNGELIAVISSTKLSTITQSHCVRNFVFCHLSQGLDAFYKRCQPAFTSSQSAYLHLIYNSKQDREWLNQRYLDRKVLENLYSKLKNHSDEKGYVVMPDNLGNEMNLTEFGIESGLSLFEELELLHRNDKDIQFLTTPEKKDLGDSETYSFGNRLKQKIRESEDFQNKDSIEQIWDKILEKLDVDPEISQQVRNNLIQQDKVTDIENNDRQATVNEQENTDTPPSHLAWPQRTLTAFKTLRLQASQKSMYTNIPGTDTRSAPDLNETDDMELQEDALVFMSSEENGEYRRKYNLAIKFAQEHGSNSLEEGIVLLIEDQDDPNYDFTEDETNMLQAFQAALMDFQKQSGESTQEKNGEGMDTTIDSENVEQTDTAKRPRAKVNAEQVRDIRERAADGETLSNLSKEYGMSSTGIWNIVNRNTWKDVE